MAYVRPQVQVFQEFQTAPQEVVQNLNAFIFGPNYQLFRFSEDAEKDLIGVGEYDKDAGNSVSYPNQPSNTTVDVDYVKVFAEDVLLRYITFAEDADNPLMAVSSVERNRLRAAPKVGAVDEVTTGPTIDEAGGYHTGRIDLPESYYLTPKATFDLGTVDGVYEYVTTEGETGEIDIPDDATTASVIVQGPDGITLDFDTAGTVQSPIVATFEDDLGASFTLEATLSRRAAQIDFAILAAALRINVDAAAGALAGTYDSVAHILTLAFAVTDSLAAIRTELLSGLAAGQADFLIEFTVSEITGGAGIGDAVTAVDQDAASVATVADIDVFPVAHRIPITENTIVFQTANGFARHPGLLRDVLVGDRIRWTVTSALTTNTEVKMAKVVGFEADLTNPTLGLAAPKGGNKASAAGDDLSSGAALITAGGDNQRDMDGAATAAFSLGVADYGLGDLARGVLDFAVAITISKTGLAGVAEATVEYASGIYRRTSVPIEATGTEDGQIHIGNNVYLNFEVGGGDADAEFQLGDVYTAAVGTPVTAVTNQVVSGDYTGQGDTTYVVDVLRGGVFDRVTIDTDGLTQASGATITSDLAAWLGGDVDDEYVLECAVAGSITTAQWTAKSVNGDIQTGISFAGLGIGNKRTIGSKGLEVYLTHGGTPAFAVGDYFVVSVKAARPQVRVTDSAGLDQEISSIANDGDAITLGLNGGSITFPANSNTLGGVAAAGGLVLGDSWTVEAKASAEGPIQTLVLSDDVFDEVTPGQEANGDSNHEPDLFEIDLFLIQNSAEIPEEQHDPAFAPGTFNWEADENGVEINDGITLQDASWVDGFGAQPYLEMWEGDLLVEYRALLQEYTNGIFGITDISEVALQLGTIHPDNPLAQGVYKAMENSGSVTVYFMATPSDDLLGFSTVLNRASLTDIVYAFAPVTRDEAILALVEGHVENMSNEVQKKWRIAFFGTETPSTGVVANSTNHPTNADWMATIKDDPTTSGTQYTRVELTEDADLLSGLKAGDTVHFRFSTDAWGNQTHLTGEVASVETDKVFYLKDDVGFEIDPAEKIELYHPLSTQEIADATAARSAAFGDRRIYHVFPDSLGAFGTTLTAEYGACAIAGLTASVLPQQGLTNIEVNGFDDIPAVYSVFNADQLDTIAGGGTLIIMQETLGGNIFVRHQISTAYGENDLNQSELSLVKNLDSISYIYANALRPFIGVFNVTPDVIDQISLEVRNILASLGSLTDALGTVSPQIILEGSELSNIQQHPVLKDRLLITVNLNLPVPLNVIEMHLVV